MATKKTKAKATILEIKYDELIIFDTETTGLPKPTASSLDLQPKIIEYAAIKVNRNLEIIDTIEFKVNPKLPLEAIITKITGLTDKDLEDEQEFNYYYDELCQFHLGVNAMLAHNVEFDRKLLTFDLMRMGKQYNFPWPQHHLCTVEATFHLNNRRMKLEELSELATGVKPNQTHRAMDDVMMLYECVKYCVKERIPL